MTILQKPNATVGQIVKDLEQIVEKNPGIFLEYCYDGEDMYVEGIKLRKDIAILETTGKKKRAVTAEDLLAMFRLLDASLGVVIQEGWEMLNFEPYKNGAIFKYDEEEDFCQFMMDRDVRLLTTQQIEAELKKVDMEGFLDFKVVPQLWHGNKLTVYRANCLRYNYGKLCLCYDEDEESDSITVGEFLKGFPTCAEFMVPIEGKYYTVKVAENGSFFSFPKLVSAGVTLFTIHLGEMVFDPNEM